MISVIRQNMSPEIMGWDMIKMDETIKTTVYEDYMVMTNVVW